MESTFRGIPADAVTEGASALTEHLSHSGDWSKATPAMARSVLEAAYPAIRVSVAREVLEEVVAALSKDWYERGAGLKAAEFIEREFGFSTTP